MIGKLWARTWSIRFGVVGGPADSGICIWRRGSSCLTPRNSQTGRICRSILDLRGFLYVRRCILRVQGEINKLLFACLQIVVAMGTDWYQTGKFAEEMTKTQSIDHWAFIIASQSNHRKESIAEAGGSQVGLGTDL
jgi:hypothetical protein